MTEAEWPENIATIYLPTKDVLFIAMLSLCLTLASMSTLPVSVADLEI